jgi:predicted nucleic acid-binding protein
MEDHPKLLAHLGAVDALDRVATCSIVVGEILYGIERLPAGRRRAELLQKASGVLASLACEAVTPAAAEQYAKIKDRRAKMGRTVHENDLWIAATAKSLGAVLVTRDGDFRDIDGLTVEDWNA